MKLKLPTVNSSWINKYKNVFSVNLININGGYMNVLTKNIHTRYNSYNLRDFYFYILNYKWTKI